ncbi:MAG: hypothetical protein IPK31_07080 [Chitinophagaceae bacterium]|nr:hypothetical protein [Chitinophagaceae bacterium]
MKQFALLAAVILFAVACQNAADTKDETKTTETKAPAAGMFAANYSNAFEMGDMALADKAVLHSWKNWEANKFDGLGDFFADTVTALWADGTTFTGTKDSLINEWKKVRANITTVVDSVDAYMPVYSTDKKENWVLIWVVDYSTDKKGVKDTTSYQETWRFNKDGKADLVLQYQRKRKK